ncbi:hypothetical protein NIES204_37180 [Planktothrix agardhii NIES-204]|nr:hypothetical protein NIES204_37180 [Planktothrix agardhii NIES-204]
MNFLVLLNWTQAESDLLLELETITKVFLQHHDRSNLSVLIDYNGISSQEVDLYLSGVIMNLLLEGDEQLETQLDISLISPENFEEWFNAIITANYKILGSNVDEKQLNEWLKIIPSITLETIKNTERYKLLSTVNEEQKIFKLQLAHQCFHAQRFTEAANLGRNLLLDYPELVEIGFSILVAHSLILSLNWYEIAANLPPGINYLLTSGWLNSLYQSKPVTQDNRPIPCYTYKNCTSLFFKKLDILDNQELPSQKKSLLGKGCFHVMNPKPDQDQ